MSAPTISKWFLASARCAVASALLVGAGISATPAGAHPVNPHRVKGGSASATFVPRAAKVGRSSANGRRTAKLAHQVPQTARASDHGLLPSFAPDSVWNAALPAAAPLDPTSSQLVGALGSEVASELGEQIGPWIATKGSGTIYSVGAGQPTVTVQLDDPTLWWRTALQSAFAAVPIPADAAPSVGPDAEMTLLQPSTDRLWEFFHMRKESDGWHAAWGGAIENVSQSPGYYTTSSWPGSLPQWGATATSLPVVAGEITLAEIQSGQIDHALAINLPAPRQGVFSWPAQRSDGTGGPQTIPEGAHLRLDPNLDLSSLHLSPLVLMMAQAAQKYGMIVRDQTHHAISFFIQDPASTGSNPFYTNGVSSKTGSFAGKSPIQLMKTFPWSSVQVLQMSLQSTSTKR